MNEVLEQYKKLKQDLELKRKEFSIVAEKALTEGSKGIFSKHPALEQFGWRQYTPYFNDGDECIFRVNSDYPLLNGEDYDDLHYKVRKWDSVSGMYVERSLKEFEGTLEEFNVSVKLVEAGRSVTEFLSSFDDDLLKDIFGDHVVVTISRNGIVNTDFYEHD